jgi:hypothetical protein
MKNLIKVVLSLFIMIGFLHAEPLSQNGEKNGYTIKLSSEKSLVSGNNEIFIVLGKNDTIVNDAKVKIKVFMPEMPGMPYMEYKGKAKLVGDKYKVMVNFAMSGTWQYHIKFKTQDGKVHTVRGSVNI